MSIDTATLRCHRAGLGAATRTRVRYPIAVALALSAATLLLGGSAMAQSPATSASPPATSALPSAALLAPSAVIDLPDTSGVIPVVADGEDIWAAVHGAIVHVDGQTNAQTRITAPDRTGDGPLALAPDGLWIGSYSGSLIERLDAATGSVELKASAAAPVRLVVIGNDVWVALHSGGLYPVDRTTGALGTKIVAWPIGGAWWSGDPYGAQVMRVDPATGKVIATITVPEGSSCVFASSTGAVWAGCSVFQREVGPQGATIVAIDPDTNTVKTVLTVPGWSAALVVDDALWLIVPREQEDGTIASSLVVIDPANGQRLATWDLGPLDADTPVVTSTALWIPDEQGKRVLRFDRADVRP